MKRRTDPDERSNYNLEGGQRLLLEVNGAVKAVAPGLRLVEATEQEKRAFREAAPRKELREYGLPV